MCEDAPAIPPFGTPNWPGLCPYGSWGDHLIECLDVIERRRRDRAAPTLVRRLGRDFRAVSPATLRSPDCAPGGGLSSAQSRGVLTT